MLPAVCPGTDSTCATPAKANWTPSWTSWSTRLNDVERRTGLHLTAERAHTHAGWMLGHPHRLADPGDQVHPDGAVATVGHTDGPRITSIALHRDDEPQHRSTHPDSGPWQTSSTDSRP